MARTEPDLWFGAHFRNLGEAEAHPSGPQPESPPPPSVEKEQPTLGDLNPLIHFPDLGRRESVAALAKIALEKIRKYDGVIPTRLESTLVCSYRYSSAPPQLRFIARFEVQHLSPEQINLLEDLVKYTYPVKVRTRLSSDGKKTIAPEIYYPINPGEVDGSKTAGWYMGPDQSDTDSLHKGLTIHKDLGPITDDNFLDERIPTKYVIEIREAEMYQTDLVQFIIQVATILGKGRLLDPGQLLNEVYYDLIRLGLKKINPQSVYGMGATLARIKNAIIYPCANPEFSQAINQQGDSVLLVGFYGTGKTLSVVQLLNEDTGVIIVPVDPLVMVKEMAKDPEKQTILPRIADISRRTNKICIPQVDDIEEMARNDTTYSTLLNLMQGVRDSGFLLIASTNEPEKIPPALIQPGRFGEIIYCPLQTQEARFEILKINALEASLNLRLPLFNSIEERDSILRAIAVNTEYFTPRFLAKIVTVAKSYLLSRVINDKGKSTGLTETDLQGYSFTIDDFRRAFRQVSSSYDRQRTKKRDEELRQFVLKNSHGPLGFQPNGQHPDTDFF